MTEEVKETARKYDRQERYTYTDYAAWDTEDRYELIDGVAYMMSAPTATHQRILGKLYRQLANYLVGKTCEVFLAPFDVCLNARGDDDDTVVQPDLLVICDKTILDDKRCNGAPDMIIEIISPSSSRRDRIVKMNKYLSAGVREYWIVDPEFKSVNRHILESGKYVVSAYEDNETVSVNVLEGCVISLPEVFAG